MKKGEILIGKTWNGQGIPSSRLCGHPGFLLVAFKFNRLFRLSRTFVSYSVLAIILIYFSLTDSRERIL